MAWTRIMMVNPFRALLQSGEEAHAMGPFDGIFTSPSMGKKKSWAWTRVISEKCVRRACVRACVHVSMCVCACVRVRMCACVHVCMYGCTHTCTHAHTHTHIKSTHTWGRRVVSFPGSCSTLSECHPAWTESKTKQSQLLKLLVDVVIVVVYFLGPTKTFSPTDYYFFFFFLNWTTWPEFQADCIRSFTEATLIYIDSYVLINPFTAIMSLQNDQ